MAEITTTSDAPRVLVLGAPGSGKSALIDSIGSTAAVFLECDGGTCRDLLAGEALANGVITKEFKNADAVLLTIDEGEIRQFEARLDQAADLMKRLESERGRRSDIAGLPVYVVLTKSDLLARKDDTTRSWLARIDERKRAAGKHLEEFLDQPADAPFGEIDLHLAATALRQPPLADRLAADGTFGVTELFQGVLDRARAFHAERRQSQRRLRAAVLAALGFIVVLGLVTADFVMTRPSADVAALENAVHAALPDAPAAQRLREPLPERRKELDKLRDDPAFDRLPAALQEHVLQAFQELDAYQTLSKQFDALKRVRFFKSEEEIPKYGNELDKITLPEAYASAWADTALVKKMRQYQAQLAALSDALAAEKDWLKKRIEEGENLRRMAIPAENSPERQAWIASADDFLKRKDPSRPVPGVPNMRLRELYEVPSVKALRDEYEGVRARVEKIRGGLAS